MVRPEYVPAVLTRGLVGSILVLLGGLVVAVLPRSTPILEHDALVALRSAQAGRMLGLSVVLVGLGLLAHAWLHLCREVTRGGDDAESLALVRFATAVWAAPLVLAPPLFSRDGWSYAAQGAMAAAGISPYSHGPAVLHGPILQAVDPMWRHTAAPYGPLPITWGQALAEHTWNPLMLAIGHRLLALVGLLLLAWAMPRLAAWGRVNPALATGLVIASPLMMANGVSGLHNDLLMVGLMAVALVVAAERGWVWGAAVGGLAAAVKLPGGVACIGVALLTLAVSAPLAERVRRLAAVGAVSLAVLFGLGVVTGLGSGWVHALTVPGTVNTPLSLPTVIGGILDWLASVVGLGTEPATFLSLVRTLATAASLGFAVWVALRWPTGDRVRALSSVAAVTGALVALSPVVHLWYLLWPVPFLAAMPLRRPALSAVVIVSVIVGLVSPLDPSLHGAYLAIVFACLIIAGLLGVLLLTPTARHRVERIVSAPWLPDGPVPGRPSPDWDLVARYRGDQPVPARLT